MYAARFNGTSCLIAVDARGSVKGTALTFIATPYVILEQGLQPFEAPDYVEIMGTTESDALERAAAFLELASANASFRRNVSGTPRHCRSGYLVASGMAASCVDPITRCKTFNITTRTYDVAVYSP